MPTFRNIAITVKTAEDVQQVPEYALPPANDINDPFSKGWVPTVDAVNSVVSVFLSVYPSRQFWLDYSIFPPHPPASLYYFKLYIHEKEMVSWGCGEDENYKGRTMFAMYAAHDSEKLERGVMSFGVEDYDQRGWGRENWDMEVKVFRARERTRTEPLVNYFEESEVGIRCGRKQKGGDGCDIRS